MKLPKIFNIKSLKSDKLHNYNLSELSPGLLSHRSIINDV